ncbi:MAG: hypothetical protein HYY44_00465 [Deltaproteobacteria bacterium]|nr:hypothetical protein [Deltaproteobacteria bacterium]MBI4374381.1 hypothetical protein [Deltaproteobacteria bacterium]
MQKSISTNIQIPQEIWRAVKIRAAEEGRSMKDLILEGLKIVLGKKSMPQESASLSDLFKEFSGTIQANVTDGSSDHDRYLDKK